ncbi:hypothetical protein C8R44DRAFT_827715 [Mycena epipterygia]|nr:hypothetical protein C8R44DRAFT_827715 [Mycena epipterygia]
MDSECLKRQNELHSHEIYWRDLVPWLQECGYMLRPRYRVGWIPSLVCYWGSLHLFPFSYPSEGIQQTTRTLDAVRVSDGAVVLLKKAEVQDHPDELTIRNFLSLDPLSKDSKSRFLPFLEVLNPPSIPGTQLLVMKLLRKYDDPRFDTIGEAVDFFRQIFEVDEVIFKFSLRLKTLELLGLQFMHKNLHQSQNRDLPPKYYFIDFGISFRSDPSLVGAQPAMPVDGGDKSVPEHEGDGFSFSTDPFVTDMYFLDNLIRTEFLDVRPKTKAVIVKLTPVFRDSSMRYVKRPSRFGFEFMRPLVDEMVKRNSKERPTIDQVVERFKSIVDGLSTWKLRSRARGREEHTILSLPRIVRHWYRRIGFTVRKAPAIPSYKA